MGNSIHAEDDYWCLFHELDQRLVLYMDRERPTAGYISPLRRREQLHDTTLFLPRMEPRFQVEEGFTSYETGGRPAKLSLPLAPIPVGSPTDRSIRLHALATVPKHIPCPLGNIGRTRKSETRRVALHLWLFYVEPHGSSWGTLTRGSLHGCFEFGRHQRTATSCSQLQSCHQCGLSPATGRC